jgi:hypothetical protein
LNERFVVSASSAAALRIARRRLVRQHLVSPVLAGAADVVRMLGAVQAQDYAGAKWGVGQRAVGLTDADVDRAFDSGAIIRTHVLRPTWHFVAPDDLRWMLALSGPRVSATMTYYNRLLGLDRTVFRKSNATLTRALRDARQLTRRELVSALGSAGLKVPTGQHAAHLLMQAELDGVICSGARRGKQHTYALLDERVPPTRMPERDEALAELTRRYFATRGPATLRDFSWWSGLTMADARRGADVVGSFLHRERDADGTEWLAPSTAVALPRARTAHLLPNYDEYFIGFKDRSAISCRLRDARSLLRSDALATHIVIIDGQIVGGWKRAMAKPTTIRLELLVPLTPAERKLVEGAVRRLGAFLDLPLRIRQR